MNKFCVLYNNFVITAVEETTDNILSIKS